LVLTSLAIGCGPNPKLVAADETLMATVAAVDESDQAIRAAESESPSARVDGTRGAWERVNIRLEEAQGILRTWQDTGSGELAWVTMAPCLAASLVGLRVSLEAAGIPIPPEVPQAETMAADPAGDECESEPRPEIADEDVETDAETDVETDAESSSSLTPAQ
jgi:hypothetical protein